MYLKLPQDEQDEANALSLSISRQPQNRISHCWLHPHYTYLRCYVFTLTCIIFSSLAVHPNPSAGTRFESPLQFSCGQRLVDLAEYGSQRMPKDGSTFGQSEALPAKCRKGHGRGIDLLLICINWQELYRDWTREDSWKFKSFRKMDGIWWNPGNS